MKSTKQKRRKPPIMKINHARKNHKEKGKKERKK